MKYFWDLLLSVLYSMELEYGIWNLVDLISLIVLCCKIVSLLRVACVYCVFRLDMVRWC